MATHHHYQATVRWTGNRGTGTSGYRAFGRDHVVSADGPPPIPGSSDPAFRGDASRWNPEQLLVAALSECHLLWYLHLCAASGVVVLDYADVAAGTMAENPAEQGGGGRFTEVVLRPQVVVAEPDMVPTAIELHRSAHERCFIANSVNFPVRHQPTVKVAESAT